MDYDRQERPTFEQKLNFGLGVLQTIAFPIECFCRRNVGRHWIGFRWAKAALLIWLCFMLWAEKYQHSRDEWANPMWLFVFLAAMWLRAAYLQAAATKETRRGRQFHRHFLGDCVYADWYPRMPSAQVLRKREFGINVMFSICLSVLNGPVGTMLLASSLACQVSLDWNWRQEQERIYRLRDQRIEAEWMSKELED